MNYLNLTGRLTRDPEGAYTPQGTAVAKFTIAVDRNLTSAKREEAEQQGQPTADFIPVVAFGRLAESILQYTTKGKRICVSGRLQTSTYEDKDKKKHFSMSVILNQAEFIDWADKNDSDGYLSDFIPVDGMDDRMPF